jgi:hypothetical protein
MAMTKDEFAEALGDIFGQWNANVEKVMATGLSREEASAIVGASGAKVVREYMAKQRPALSPAPEIPFF